MPGSTCRSRPAEQEAVADVLVDAVLANQARRAAVLLYTDDVEAAHAQADVLLARLLEHGVEVIDVLRVDDGHWHRVPSDGSPGTPYRLDTHPFTAQRVFEGQVVHRDREDLADSLVGTDEEDAVEVALAATRFADLVAGSGRRRRTGSCGPRRGGCSDASGRASTTGSSSTRRTQDDCWCSPRSCRPAMSRGRRSPAPPRHAHVDLWRELVRRSPRDLLPGPASLLAFAAWQHGDGALAWCAIDRCLEVDPDYSMAHYVAEVLTHAVPPDGLAAAPGGRPAGLPEAWSHCTGATDRAS